MTMPGKEALAGVCDLPPPPKARPGEGVPAKDGASKNEAAPMRNRRWRVVRWACRRQYPAIREQVIIARNEIALVP